MKDKRKVDLTLQLVYRRVCPKKLYYLIFYNLEGLLFKLVLMSSQFYDYTDVKHP